jgi:hypothetical protein
VCTGCHLDGKGQSLSHFGRCFLCPHRIINIEVEMNGCPLPPADVIRGRDSLRQQ